MLIFLAYLFTPWTAINLTDYFFVRRGLYSIKEIFRPADMCGRWGWRGQVAYLDPVLGVRKTSIGIRGGRLASVGRAGNPDTLAGVTVVVGTGTAVISGEGLIATPGGIDTHVHLLSPRILEAELSSGMTTVLGQEYGPVWGVGVNDAYGLRRGIAAGVPNIVSSSTNPTLPYGRDAVAEHLAMIMSVHGLKPGLPGDLALARDRIREGTMAAGGVLHDLGVIPISSSDAQGMGWAGETWARTFALAAASPGSTSCSHAGGKPPSA